MQLVDSKLYSANVAAFRSVGVDAMADRSYAGADFRRARANRGDLLSWLKGTSAAQRMFGLLLAAFFVAASPALLATVRSTVSLSFQILLQAGHVGLTAFQIFGR